MPTQRKFYRTIIQAEVLSQEPLPEFLDLEDLNYETLVGEWSGRVQVKASETLDGPQMAKALMEQDSDPEFFNLTADGEDHEEQ